MASIASRTERHAHADARAVSSALRDEYGSGLYGFALLLTLGDRGRAAELADASLRAAEQRISDFAEPTFVAAWLRRHVLWSAGRGELPTWLLLGKLRRLVGRQEAELHAPLHEMQADSAMLASLSTLSVRERAALVLADVEHLDETEISDVLGSSRGVRRLINQARYKYARSFVTAAELGMASHPPRLPAAIRRAARSAAAAPATATATATADETADQHRRFEDWLFDGGQRTLRPEVAAHAADCNRCTVMAAGLAALSGVNTRALPIPAEGIAAVPNRRAGAWQLQTAAAATIVALAATAGIVMSALTSGNSPLNFAIGQPRQTETSVTRDQDPAGLGVVLPSPKQRGLGITPGTTTDPSPSEASAATPTPSESAVPSRNLVGGGRVIDGGGGTAGGGVPVAPPPPSPPPAEPPAACSDGLDNDVDGATDFPADPGCVSSTDTDETNAPTPGVTPTPPIVVTPTPTPTPTTEPTPIVLSQCENLLDDDGDGAADFPDDPGCASADDNTEAPNPPPPTPDPTPQPTPTPEPTPDPTPVPACMDGGDNDGDGMTDMADPGCDFPTDTAEWNPAPTPEPTPTPDPTPTPACSDGVDNDGDGFTDMNDPGCDGPGDTAEWNPEPACRDGNDNDGDLLTDHPNDPGCESPDDTSEFNEIIPPPGPAP